MDYHCSTAVSTSQYHLSVVSVLQAHDRESHLDLVHACHPKSIRHAAAATARTKALRGHAAWRGLVVAWGGEGCTPGLRSR